MRKMSSLLATRSALPPPKARSSSRAFLPNQSAATKIKTASTVAIIGQVERKKVVASYEAEN